MPFTPPPGQSTGQTLLGETRRFSQSLALYLRARIELLQFEWTRESRRLTDLMLHGVLLALFVAVTFEFAVGWVVAYFWYTQWRMPVISIMLGVAVAVTVALLVTFLARRGQAAEPLKGTIDEFR
jgi:uncharacterized membrane protein YqjE